MTLLYLMLSMSASFADLSALNFYLSYAIKTALQLWLVVRFCVIEGLRVTPWAHLQTITQVRRKGYSPTTSNFLSSILVPEEFSGGQEICLISSFGFVCNCGSVVELIELEVVKHGSIWAWRWHWGTSKTSISCLAMVSVCVCGTVHGDSTSPRRLMKG